MKDEYPVRSPDIVMRSEEKEALLFNPADGNIMCINGTGIMIWNLCDGGNSSDKIAKEITEKYDVSIQNAENDYREFLKDLEKAGFVGYKT